MNYNYRFLLLLFCVLTITTSCARENKIEVSISSKPNDKVYIAKYWNSDPYAIDSITLSEDGKGVFMLKEDFEPGQYLLFSRPDLQLDLLIGNKNVDIKLDIDVSGIEKCKVKGSKDTELLWQYLYQQSKQTVLVDSLESELQKSGISQEDVDRLLQELETTKVKFEKYAYDLIDKNQKEWFGIFLKGITPVKIPLPQSNTEEAFLLSKQYHLDHYFDNIDLKDPRMWTTNYLSETIDQYIQSLNGTHPDSLANAACKVIESTMGNQKAFENVASKFINEFSHSKIMGRENIWAKIFEKYIDEKNMSWIDEASLSKLKTDYEALKNNRIGMTAKNMGLTTLKGDSINSNEIEANYLMLFFYSTDCSYCHTEAPLLEKVRQKYKDHDVKILGIDVKANDSPKDWARFVKDHKLEKWINTADLSYTSEYWLNYDISGTPVLYLLDKNKQIIGRKLSSENVEVLLKGYIEAN